MKSLNKETQNRATKAQVLIQFPDRASAAFSRSKLVLGIIAETPQSLRNRKRNDQARNCPESLLCVSQSQSKPSGPGQTERVALSPLGGSSKLLILGPLATAELLRNTCLCKPQGSRGAALWLWGLSATVLHFSQSRGQSCPTSNPMPS